MTPHTLRARDALRKLFFRRSWSTRGRNLDVARCLNAVLLQGELLLDVGCGETGLSDFVRSASVIGTDIHSPSVEGNARSFVRATITALPFADASFPAVAAVDVLEHLPAHAREAAVAELIRVTRGSAVVAFPSGHDAQQADEDFQRNLRARRKAPPPWLEEHLQSSYPTAAAVIAAMTAAAARQRRQIETTVLYSEDIRVTRLIRWAASQSDLLLMAIDFVAGLSAPLIRPPDACNSYRTIVVAQFR